MSSPSSSVVDSSVTFHGYGMNSADPALQFHKVSYHPRVLGQDDVEIEIECCGICSSDIHTASGNFKQN